MTLIVVGHEVGREEEGHRVSIWGEYSGGGDNYASAIAGYKKWHIGVEVGHHNVKGYLGHTLYKGWTGEAVPNRWGTIF